MKTTANKKLSLKNQEQVPGEAIGSIKIAMQENVNLSS